jgi:hypothetical protein
VAIVTRCAMAKRATEKEVIICLSVIQKDSKLQTICIMEPNFSKFVTGLIKNENKNKTSFNLL